MNNIHHMSQKKVYIEASKHPYPLMKKVQTKYYILLIIVCSYIPVIAQQKSAVIPPLNAKQQDSTYLVHPLKDAEIKFKKGFSKFVNQQFSNHSNTVLYLLGGLSLSKQNIDLGGYQSNLNYEMTDFKNGGYQAGYFAGFRIDGTYKNKHQYALGLSINSLSFGTSYKKLNSMPPFLGSFSSFKPDEQFYTLSLTAYYKKLIQFGDTAKRRFYFVIGPRIDTRLSAQSEDNQINKNYKTLFLSADTGIEFDNNAYYTLFLHYKRGLSSFTKSPIQTNLDGFELGVMVKASDLF